MAASTILTVTSDQEFLTLFREQLRAQVGGKGRMTVARSIDEACSRLETTRPRLIVVHWTHDSSRYEQLDRLLWTTSVKARRTLVLVIAERYRTDQATMMYRMGVSEYVSRTHHLGQLGRVFGAYLPGATPATAEAVPPHDAPVPADKSWGKRHVRRPLAARVV
jgi:DNA-binding response OmpR family regulator